MEANTEESPAGRVVIAGGTGFLGGNLARRLSDAGCDVVVLGRHRPAEQDELPWRFAVWNARTLGAWSAEINGAAALVNLAGRSVDCIKTPDHCDEILRSRVESTRVLGQALRTIDQPPPVWVQMSTAHRYGDAPELVCDEDSAFGYGLAPRVGEAWEEAYAAAVLPGMRQVILRTSFVLGKTGGALRTLAWLVRFRLGGKVGHGRQGISWIHEHDMDRLFVQSITDPTMQGAYLATAPHPVAQEDFMRELRRAMGVRIGLPATSLMVRFGAHWLLRTDPELGLYGRYCVSRRLREHGFRFEFPQVGPALMDLYGKRKNLAPGS
ncbi:Epimerase family protein [Lignipirellula cremea]|uniref:Epimerase family protein n=1 Tax=Lignipirellula cremea TaxID=2528010 RepID=A0A518E4Y2_9BACT|nr:Epimerase family protein [Lignipirellula cremea]